MYGKGLNAYREVTVTTADPKRLVIMCYEGAIRHLRLAKEKFISKEFEEKYELILKAQAIISELRQALDFERGGEIAKNLDMIYSYMIKRITRGDIKNDIFAYDEVINMLDELKSAWTEVFYGRVEAGCSLAYGAEQHSFELAVGM
ncbi:MAG: flagellar export chaperone FliS [Pseudomonadota bacterium]